MKKLSKNKKTAIFVSLAVILFFFATASVIDFISNSTGEESAALGELFESEESPSVNDLLISDTVLGEGAEAVSGKIITVHYTGTLMDGTKFDSSLDRGAPFKFILGAGQVIQGWEQGFAGMKVGGKRKLVIPPQLGYGDQAIGSIPANSILVFDVELLDVENQ
jgi:FKBP-type peptidyl-prolyl cis-trans isomerase|tara:strand:- start:8216 stop:8707 length:492 start_codon:yes stop_codon:yes gene_type:complete